MNSEKGSDECSRCLSLHMSISVVTFRISIILRRKISKVLRFPTLGKQLSGMNLEMTYILRDFDLCWILSYHLSTLAVIISVRTSSHWKTCWWFPEHVQLSISNLEGPSSHTWPNISYCRLSSVAMVSIFMEFEEKVQIQIYSQNWYMTKKLQ